MALCGCKWLPCARSSACQEALHEIFLQHQPPRPQKKKTYLCSYTCLPYLLFAPVRMHVFLNSACSLYFDACDRCITVHWRNCRGLDGHSRWRIQWSYWQHLTWPESRLVCVRTTTACRRSCSDTWLKLGMLKLGVSTLPETSQTSQQTTSYCNRNGPAPGKELEYCAENLAASSGPVLWASRLNNCPCWTPWLDNLCSSMSAAPFQLPYSEASWCTAKGVSRSFPKNISNIKPSPRMRTLALPKWRSLVFLKIGKRNEDQNFFCDKTFFATKVLQIFWISAGLCSHSYSYWHQLKPPLPFARPPAAFFGNFPSELAIQKLNFTGGLVGWSVQISPVAATKCLAMKWQRSRARQAPLENLKVFPKKTSPAARKHMLAGLRTYLVRVKDLLSGLRSTFGRKNKHFDKFKAERFVALCWIWAS